MRPRPILTRTGLTRTGLLLTALALTATPAAAQHWSRSWMAAPLAWKAPADKRPDLTDRTIRQVVRISSGGQRIRLRLSNEMAIEPLTIGAVHVALAGADGGDPARHRPHRRLQPHAGRDFARPRALAQRSHRLGPSDRSPA